MRLHFIHNIIPFLIWVYNGLDNSLNIKVLSGVNANQIAENYFCNFASKIKKEQQKTHTLEQLSVFIRYLTNPLILKKGLTKPQCLSGEDFSPEFERDKRKISKKITKIIKN